MLSPAPQALDSLLSIEDGIQIGEGARMLRTLSPSGPSSNGRGELFAQCAQCGRDVRAPSSYGTILVAGSLQGLWPLALTAATLGSRMVNTAPPSGALATVKVPPCSVITRWANARPMPWPWVLVVKKGMKIFCKSAAAMPAPVSLIEIVAQRLP